MARQCTRVVSRLDGDSTVQKFDRPKNIFWHLTNSGSLGCVIYRELGLPMFYYPLKLKVCMVAWCLRFSCVICNALEDVYFMVLSLA